MKQNFLLLTLLILLATTTSFSQIRGSIEVVNEFWQLAQKNDFESAKSHIDTVFFGAKNLDVLRQDFQTISKSEFNKLEISQQKKLFGKAILTFKLRGKNKKQAILEVSLVKSLTTWKISSLKINILNDSTVFGDRVVIQRVLNVDFKNRNYTPLVPHNPSNPDKNPVRVIAEPYNPAKNPITFQKIIPNAH